MGIDDLLGDRTPAPPPRLTPRSPISVKELTAILVLGGLVWAAYDRLNHFADKTAVEAIATAQWQARLDAQHNFDVMRADLKALTEKVDAIKPEKHVKP
jgi:hypothetical protein